jgi:hypothetical protein
MLESWHVYTESGSCYEVHCGPDGDRWLTVPTAPSSPGLFDLRGRLTRLLGVNPWPPRIGAPLLLMIVIEDGPTKLRLTTPVVRLDGPYIRADA